MLVGDFARVGDERLVGDLGDPELVLEALGVREHEPVLLRTNLAALVAEPAGPDVDRLPRPEGVSVELSGFALMGTNGGPNDKLPPLPDAPAIRVRAFSLMGGVGIERKKRRRPRA